MAITFQNAECGFRLKDKRKTAVWIRQCVAEEGFGCGDIAYIFCSPDYHMDINRRYLGHDYHTDVITFDYTDPATKTVCGDIFIDPATVSSNAAAYGDTPQQEMLRVMIHGVLHLCGYNDKTPAQQKTMRGKENHYLAKWQDG